MATVKQCDRCKAIYEKNESMLVDKEERLHFGSLRMLSRNGYTVADYDLCNNCVQKFLNWIGGDIEQ